MQKARSPSRSHKNALKSAHFVLSVLPSTVPDDTFFMAIPKRLLKRAVDRNAVKRVCREAWRSHRRNAGVIETGIKDQGTNRKLVKLISVPSFESTTQLKQFTRVDLDDLFAKLK